MNDANKPQVMAALQRIKETYETKKDEVEILCEEGLALLAKLAWSNKSLSSYIIIIHILKVIVRFKFILLK